MTHRCMYIHSVICFLISSSAIPHPLECFVEWGPPLYRPEIRSVTVCSLSLCYYAKLCFIQCCPVFDPPVITPMSPVDVVEGQNLTLTCDDPQDHRRPTNYSWSNSTTKLLNIVSFNPQQLTLTNIRRSASGIYICSIHLPDAPHLRPKQSNITINVLCESANRPCKPCVISSSSSFSSSSSSLFPDPPSVFLPLAPITQPRNTPLTLSCGFDANPTPNITWSFNGTELSLNPPRLSVEITGSASVLQFSSLEVTDTGEYSCMADNGIGSPNNGTTHIIVLGKCHQYLLLFLLLFLLLILLLLFLLHMWHVYNTIIKIVWYLFHFLHISKSCHPPLTIHLNLTTFSLFPFIVSQSRLVRVAHSLVLFCITMT